jgi:hypothetical protein
MMDASKVMLVIKDASGVKRSINLQDAIDERVLYVRMNSMDRHVVCDVEEEEPVYLKQYPLVPKSDYTKTLHTQRSAAIRQEFIRLDDDDDDDYCALCGEWNEIDCPDEFVGVCLRRRVH